MGIIANLHGSRYSLCPVELAQGKAIDPISIDGFEDFCKMLGYLKCSKHNLHSDSIDGEGSFAILPSGTRRRYLIAECLFATEPNLTIIEVQVTGWSLSTLIIRGPKTYNQLAKILIDKLTKNGGHWNDQWLISASGYDIFRLKHYNGRHPSRWANLIINFRYSHKRKR